MTVTQLTFDAVELTSHTTTAPAASYGQTINFGLDEDVTTHSTGAVGFGTAPVLLPAHAPLIQAHSTGALGFTTNVPVLLPSFHVSVGGPSHAAIDGRSNIVTQGGFIYPRRNG